MFFYKVILRTVKYCLINFIIFTLLLSFKRHFLPGILFYEGMIILVFSTTLLLLYLWKFNNHLDDKIHNYYSTIISFFLILTFHTTVITIVDRSISVFLISNVHNGINNPIKIKKKFVDDFSNEGINKRIEEQLAIGNLSYSQDSLKLTNKGNIYYLLFKSLNIVYVLDKNIIH
jgi:hypothetical protein